MRTLTAVLYVLALALGAGGVSIRKAAADDPAAPAPEAAPAADAAKNEGAPLESNAAITPPAANPSDPGSCKPEPVIQVTVPLERFHSENFVNLNTRGYNYPAPDDPPERYVPDSTHGPQPLAKPAGPSAEKPAVGKPAKSNAKAKNKAK